MILQSYLYLVVRLTREMAWMAAIPLISLSRNRVWSLFSSNPVWSLATTITKPFFLRAKLSRAFSSLSPSFNPAALCSSWLLE